MPNLTEEIEVLLTERFGHDCLIALATVDSAGSPWVRTVNAYYENGAFYVITYALSNKMQHVLEKPHVALCGDWFTARGIGRNMGHVLADANQPIIDKLRHVFASWYGNGHINENDPNTCILKIELTEGALFSKGTRYVI